jgi:hypothetical protein
VQVPPVLAGRTQLLLSELRRRDAPLLRHLEAVTHALDTIVSMYRAAPLHTPRNSPWPACQTRACVRVRVGVGGGGGGGTFRCLAGALAPCLPTASVERCGPWRAARRVGRA